MKFSHTRYFKIRLRQVLFKFGSNSPYISGDSIAALADYVVFGRNKKRKVSIRRLNHAKSIFVPGEKLHELLENYGHEIKANCLITGNSDENFTILPDLPDSVRLWLCQNNAITNSRVVKTLPIGIENRRLGRNGFPSLYKKSYSNASTSRVLVPPMSPTNPIRTEIILQARERSEIFDVHTKLIPEMEYFQLTRRYKFILCCEGNGFENHRIWETLYQGSFPILLRTNWSTSLEYLNLPILFVESLNDVDPKLLEDFYQQNKSFLPHLAPALWIPFWDRLIKGLE
jgi:hypothetical protein